MLRKCARKQKNLEIFVKKSEILEIFVKNQEILQNSKIYVVFEVFAVLGVFPSERAQKMLKFGVLDAKKFDDTAENEPKQAPKSEKL